MCWGSSRHRFDLMVRWIAMESFFALLQNNVLDLVCV
jgi:hypothetical protein